MADRITTNTSGETGPEAPNQPIYEGYEPDEPQASTEGQAQQPADQQIEVPTKFILEDGSVDVESLAKSYAELEKMQSGVQPEQPLPDQPEGMQEGETSLLVSSEEMQGFGEQVLQNGDLDAETKQSLIARGLPEELVETHVAGIKALMEQRRVSLLDEVGGEEQFNQVISWAKDNLSESEQALIDQTFDTGDLDTIRTTMAGLHARFLQSEGRPNLISGNVGSTDTTAGFTSWQQLSRAMQDPRYKSDPSYQREVQNRVALSNNLDN